MWKVSFCRSAQVLIAFSDDILLGFEDGTCPVITNSIFSIFLIQVWGLFRTKFICYCYFRTHLATKSV